MSNCIKYPILFNDKKKKFQKNEKSKLHEINLEKNKLHEAKLEKSKSDDYTDENYEYDDEFKNDCSEYSKLPHILPAKKRIIAIGDLHGDYDLTIECLKIAKVINDDLDWIAKPSDTVVVQIGDQVDRCRPIIGKKCDNPDTTPNDEGRDIDILELFNKLHKKAKKYGGGVYSLLGNHEIMNVQGNMNYVSYEGLEQFKDEINPDTGKKFKNGAEARTYLFKRGNKYANMMACTRQTAVIIGSNLFVHAAIVPKLAKIYNVKDINVMIRKWLLKEFSSNKPVKGIGTLKDILVNYEVSPFWPRLLGNLPSGKSIDDEKCIEFLKETLQLYKCNNIIIGHTPQFYSNKSGISSTCTGINEVNDKNMGVWRIDTGSSKAFEQFEKVEGQLSEQREPQVLEIIDDNTFKILK